jgi:hypothetical protein
MSRVVGAEVRGTVGMEVGSLVGDFVGKGDGPLMVGELVEGGEEGDLDGEFVGPATTAITPCMRLP